MTINIEHNGTQILNESDLRELIDQRDALAAALGRMERLAKKMAGYVKSYGLDDSGSSSEWSRWSQCRDGIDNTADPVAILSARLAAERKAGEIRILDILIDTENLFPRGIREWAASKRGDLEMDAQAERGEAKS